MTTTYKQAGVDTEAGDALVDWLQADQSAVPFQKNIISGIGGFAALFELKFPQIKNPVLVSSTDGIGTKVKLATDFKSYRSVAQDLVAMCVNDLICTGGQPLFFLDYYASGKLDLEAAKEFIAGVRDACHRSGCALIGGETAELPGLYHGRDFDAAGFSVGIVDREQILGPDRVSPGDIVIGVSSNGFHSNGFSLLRKVFAQDLEAEAKKGSGPISSMLLRPTHLYPALAKDIMADVNAIAHITGGGMENIPRVMPKGTKLELLPWSWPDEFLQAQDRANLSRHEMMKTFNCGIGLVLFANPSRQSTLMKKIEAHGFKAYELGKVEKTGSASEAQVVY